MRGRERLPRGCAAARVGVRAPAARRGGSPRAPWECHVSLQGLRANMLSSHPVILPPGTQFMHCGCLRSDGCMLEVLQARA